MCKPNPSWLKLISSPKASLLTTILIQNSAKCGGVNGLVFIWVDYITKFDVFMAGIAS